MSDAASAAPVASSATPDNTQAVTSSNQTPATGVDGQGAPAAGATPPASQPDPLIKDDKAAPKAEVKDGQPSKEATAEGEAPKEPEYNFKLPEGAKEDPELMGQFKELAKAEKLSPEMAQKIVDFAPKLSERIAQANQQAWNETIQDWQSQVKADPEIGGAKLEANLSNISKAIDSYMPKEKQALLDAFVLTGAGSNPQIVKFIARLASQVSEPKYVPGAGARSEKKTGASALYPSMKSTG